MRRLACGLDDIVCRVLAAYVKVVSYLYLLLCMIYGCVA